MGFSERVKYGFKMALNSGIDYFLTTGSVGYFMSKKLMKAVSSGGSGTSSSKGLPSIAMTRRVLKARKRAKDEGREMLPKDLFDLR